MLDPKTLDDLARRVSAALPEGVRELQQDAQRNLRAALQAAFAHLDLVPREEFEVQSQVLARTRLRLEALEKQVAALEAQILGKRPAAPTADSDDMDGG